jgi:hypothetical protein
MFCAVLQKRKVAAKHYTTPAELKDSITVAFQLVTRQMVVDMSTFSVVSR